MSCSWVDCELACLLAEFDNSRSIQTLIILVTTIRASSRHPHHTPFDPARLDFHPSIRFARTLVRTTRICVVLSIRFHFPPNPAISPFTSSVYSLILLRVSASASLIFRQRRGHPSATAQLDATRPFRHNPEHTAAQTRHSIRDQSFAHEKHCDYTLNSTLLCCHFDRIDIQHNPRQTSCIGT